MILIAGNYPNRSQNTKMSYKHTIPTVQFEGPNCRPATVDEILQVLNQQIDSNRGKTVIVVEAVDEFLYMGWTNAQILRLLLALTSCTDRLVLVRSGSKDPRDSKLQKLLQFLVACAARVITMEDLQLVPQYGEHFQIISSVGSAFAMTSKTGKPRSPLNVIV